MTNWKTFAKALVAGLLAGLAVIGKGAADGHVSASEIIASISAAIATGAATYWVPNAPRKST